MKRMFFENNLDDSKFLGVLYGLGHPYKAGGYEQQV
jgi:hypothetical protein